MIKTIKFSEIKAIKPIIASANENISQVKERAKCDIIFNGGIYTFADRSIDSPFKLDGQLYGKYNTYGFAIDNANKNIYFAHSYTDTCSEFIGEYGVLIDKNTIKDTIGLGDKRERTAIGITPNNELVIACLTGSDKCSTKATAQLLKDKGCSFAINLDGGGSTQYILEDGTKYLSGRNVVWYVGIWLEKDNEENKEEDKVKIAIDCGHTSTVAGKRSPDGSLLEYEFNRDVGSRLKAILERHGIEIVYIAPEGAESLSNRCKVANEAKVDYFVSIHANAYGDGVTWNSANGWEIYILSKGGQAEVLAEAIEAVAPDYLGLKNRGVKVANFTVLADTDMPAVLIEHGFYTNEAECELLKTSSFRQKCAESDAIGILNYLGIEYIPETTTPSTPSVPSTPIDTPADWAKEAWEKAAKKVGIDGKSIMDGTRPTDTITRQEIAVILNRLGLLD